MPHFFVPSRLIQGERFTLEEEETRHLSAVLRKKPGDVISLFDGEGRIYRGRVESIAQGRAQGRLLSAEPRAEVPLTLRLFQGLPKGEKFDWILEKMTELGASEIVPLQAERCVAKVPKEKLPSRLARWEKIVLAAAKQSGRSSVPRVTAPRFMAESLALCGEGSLTLLPWEGEKSLTLKEALRSRAKDLTSQTVNIFIGPEGGFSFAEVDMAQKQGAVLVTLGPWILRTETAGLFVASALLYEIMEKPS